MPVESEAFQILLQLSSLSSFRIGHILCKCFVVTFPLSNDGIQHLSKQQVNTWSLHHKLHDCDVTALSEKHRSCLCHLILMIQRFYFGLAPLYMIASYYATRVFLIFLLNIGKINAKFVIICLKKLSNNVIFLPEFLYRHVVSRASGPWTKNSLSLVWRCCNVQ